MTSLVQIKNCGLACNADIDAALNSGANFLGFVHYAPSPRHLSLDDIEALSAHANQQSSHSQNVIVTVNPEDALIEQINKLAHIHYLQVHGVTDIARASTISQRSSKPLILATGIQQAVDIQTAQALTPFADYLLLDYKTDQHGGSGKAFDWSLLKDVAFDIPWFLAGGLNVDNVVQALRVTGASMVDVSSGIELTPGKKSREKIAAFNATVLSTAHDENSIKQS